MKDLPLGVADFSEISDVDNNYYYVDKTHLLYEIVKRRKPYFLSRPRRFGKTPLLSTLKAILEGRRDLFKGLWIDGSNYHWTPYSVIRLEMNGINSSSKELFWASLFSNLNRIAKRAGLIIQEPSPADFLSSLILALYEKYKQKVAVLIDEYDAPILKQITKPELADDIRSELAEFYGALKTNEDMRGHVFITGISRFTKTSIFSILNNFIDITFDPAFADICGFNYEEFNVLFENRLDYTLEHLKDNKSIAIDATGEHVKTLVEQWYDGYTWDGKTKVYNPWSLLSFFDTPEFSSFWSQTGTPTYLKKLIDSRQIVFDAPKLEPITITKIQIDEIDKLDPDSLLLQSGYLTVKEIEHGTRDGKSLHLCLPNLEVELSFIPLLFSIEFPKAPLLAKELSVQMIRALFKQNASEIEEAFSGYLEQYSYDSHIAAEKYYHTLLRSALFLADQRSLSQGHTAKGIFDVHLRSPRGDDYIIEVKHLSVNGESETTEPETMPKPQKRTKTKSSETPASPKQQTEQEKLRLKMAKLAKKAITQIDKKYANMFLRGSNRVFKVALVVSDRTDVLVKIVEGRKKIVEALNR
jgi:hypothetical protein